MTVSADMSRSGALRGVGLRSAGGWRAGGFTLIEIAIAMVFLTLLAALAWPMLASRITKAELPDSADRIRSTLFMTRSAAVMEHRRHRVRFEPGEQQPIIEYEVDPIRRFGEWERVKVKWAEEPALLGNVQVHEVRIGRPFWTRPLADTDRPEDMEEAAEEELLALEGGETGYEGLAMLSPEAGMEDAEIDELRPPIVFEVDGSSDWATLYLARIEPEDELPEEEPQLWIVLDGRTAVARIHEKISEDTLADPDFYVARAKLELPDTVDLENLTLATSSAEPLAGVFGGDTAGGGSVTDQFTGSGAEDLLAGASGGMSHGGDSGGGISENGRRTGRRGDDGDGSGESNGSDDSDMDESDREAMNKLEEALANSDMSDAEKDEIRRMFQESLNEPSGR